MANTTNISIRMDNDVKVKADALFGELGMNISTAFKIFVRQSLREGRIPFDISLNQPNNDTIVLCLRRKGLQTILPLKAIQTRRKCLLTLQEDKEKIYCKIY